MAASSAFHWEITLSGLISWICLWKGLWHLVLSRCKVLMRSDPRGSERRERQWQGRQRRARAAAHPPTHSGLGISHTDTWFSLYEECVLDSSQMEDKYEWKRASWNLERTMPVKQEQKSLLSLYWCHYLLRHERCPKCWKPQVLMSRSLQLYWICNAVSMYPNSKPMLKNKNALLSCFLV